MRGKVYDNRNEPFGSMKLLFDQNYLIVKNSTASYSGIMHITVT